VLVAFYEKQYDTAIEAAKELTSETQRLLRE
jgi:hypothetical protein